MKNFTVILSFILIAVLSSNASAEHRRHSGYSQHYNNYQGSYGYGGRHYSYRHRSHSSHRDHYLLGGLVLGALLHNTYSRYREPEVVHRTVIYRTRRITNDEDSYKEEENTRRTLRDSEGRCFELTESGDGKELLKELPAEDCNK